MKVLFSEGMSSYVKNVKSSAFATLNPLEREEHMVSKKSNGFFDEAVILSFLPSSLISITSDSLDTSN